MLLLIFSNCYGTLMWPAPSPARTVVIPAEPRVVVIR